VSRTRSLHVQVIVMDGLCILILCFVSDYEYVCHKAYPIGYID